MAPKNHSRFKSHEPVDVEPFFQRFIAESGGEVLEKTLNSSPEFRNADFVFRDDGVVIELKTLMEDFASKQSVQAKFDRLLGEMLEGKAGPPDISSLSMRQMKDLVAPFRKPLDRVLESANKQIKQTKANLGLTDFAGVLIVVNDGAYSAGSQMIVSLIQDSLTRKFSSISAFIYVTLNRFTLIEGSGQPRLIWDPKYSPDSPDHLHAFVNQLGEKFGNFLMRELPSVSGTIQSEDSARLERGRFL